MRLPKRSNLLPASLVGGSRSDVIDRVAGSLMTRFPDVSWVEDDIVPLSQDLSVVETCQGRLILRREGSADLSLSQPDQYIPLGSRSRLYRRLTRRSLHHAFLSSDGSSICVFHGGSIASYCATAGEILADTPLEGSRPLVVAKNGDSILYGQYSSKDLGTAGLFLSNDCGASFHRVAQIDGVRHIHGCHWDSYRKHFWVTTGDGDEESIIWKVDPLEYSPEPVVKLGQQSRAVQLAITEDSVYWGSDSPSATNSISRMEASTGNVERIGVALGPVYYAAVCGGTIVFSTAVEPKTTSSALVYVLTISTGIVEAVAAIPKDLFPHAFQYGTVRITGDGDRLSLRLTGLVGSGGTFTAVCQCSCDDQPGAVRGPLV